MTARIQQFTLGKNGLKLKDVQKLYVYERKGLFTLGDSKVEYVEKEKNMYFQRDASSKGFIVKKTFSPPLPPLPVFDQYWNIADGIHPQAHVPAAPPSQTGHKPIMLTFDNLPAFLKRLPTDIANIIKEMSQPHILIEDYIKERSEKQSIPRYQPKLSGYNTAEGGHYTELCEVIFLNVPFREKDQAKKLKCKWAKERKQWFTRTNADHTEEAIKRWGIDNGDIIYRYYPFGLWKSIMPNASLWSAIKDMIDSGDILWQTKGFKYHSTASGIYMYENNKNLTKFKSIVDKAKKNGEVRRWD